ncbi:MAG: hypothetical protein A3C43_03985 [Candidatus Schekmanbacteria bacterium RIFCSPHIGHO2_02_FULL_38_11]|uniref:Peroxiredoxin n=1 Tax=Candidatus Schekmanbacteria bacterium RIFCSPLOWO2_12_FULL_38_15 TaxID=1817883 RepID=A0A1F7SH56_9BACT|nr:MAG: hypothetical protein A2043_04400 [Candidatus Schekmanbacteria bacterium GWA2_38_9]OGL49721.1 MAG: hypothetical protein A3H37_01680 [Candidatus Schekmanbacteria bacterium RIFCSPLOWO2_02_FULL_38_14]OGL53075.1 MAG: hypothetical protein A3G31_09235 [Candidatus Schekmanbacteria bacterium RIFCSPLOWO2_12_FULL_38_15]OGL53778.1 MAG: hypothetical protein A3C43_03985 [Candidatus Schekmanbacteria bacterium RIFCSPHIGHO2_02_FULL_38_11]
MAEEKMEKKRRRLVIFAHSSTFDRLYQTATIAVTAAAMGEEVYVVLFFEALKKFVEGKTDIEDMSAEFQNNGKDVYQKMKAMNPNSITEMIDTVKSLGTLKFLACSANVEFMGLRKEEVLKKVDEITGLPSILKLASDADTKLYI